jgi:predicted transcriptional regulator of viral defense system
MDLSFLNSPNFIFFSTREFATQFGMTVSAATKQMQRLMSKNAIRLLTRGIWANPSHPQFTVFSAVPYLLGKEHGYISFFSALHRRGVLSQIPSSIQIATTGHSRTLDSSIGRFEFFHIKPDLMKEGIEFVENPNPYRLATAEKALFDALYISTRKSKRFSSMPELDLSSENFDRRQFRKLMSSAQIPILIRESLRLRAHHYKL